jgi:NAD(P)-dependent dehydrogenase (short-subunit alcohol dehydrogenase family)
MRGLDARVASVTGGGQGIGRAIAQRLAAEGASVLVTDLDADRAAETAEKIKSDGGSALALRVDVRSVADLHQLNSEAQERFGAVPSIVVCNAGHQTFADVMSLSSEDWHDVLDVNAYGTFETMRSAGKAMQDAGVGGVIIAIASIAARLGSVHYAHYSASKAAVLSLTKSLALSLAPHGIRVNCVAPGVIDTELWAKADREMAKMLGVEPGEPKKERIARVPLGRAGTPEDVAGAVAFLASDDASYITGECLHVCGGDVML